MNKYSHLFPVLFFFALLVGCRAKAAPEVTMSLIPTTAAVQSYNAVTETSASNQPTKTILLETLSPTPNPENDRPAPPTEGHRPTETDSQPNIPTPTSSPEFTNTPGPSPTASPTRHETAGSGPSSTVNLTASRTTTSTRTPTGTLPTSTPSRTSSRTPTPTRTPTGTLLATSTQTITPTAILSPGLAFTVQFVSHYSCEGIEFLNFLVQNNGSLVLEYSKVLIIDLSGPDELTNSRTNWPFQTLPDGCNNDLGAILPGERAYMPIPINESPAPPPYPGEHQGTFTFCSEDYYLGEHGICLAKELTFTVPETE